MDGDGEVREIVAAIPAGCVATYGEIGLFVGIGPRQAGRAVSLLDDDVPWWRVVYAHGTSVTCHDGAARALRKAEGVPFLNGHVGMARVRGHRSRPNSRESSTVDFG
jgi:alkylated DNA nucleotide flippase Atl1